MKFLLASLVFVSGVAVSAQHLVPGAPGSNPGHPNYGSHGPGHPNYRPPGHGHPGHGHPGHGHPGHGHPGHGHPGHGHPGHGYPYPGNPYPAPYPSQPPYHPPHNPPYQPPHNPPYNPPYGNQCSRDLCVGHQVVAVDSGKTVTIQAVDYNGRFIVRDVYGYTYSNIDRTNLAVMYGSSLGLFVGQQVTALDSGKRVTIIAIQLNGRFVVRDVYGYTYTNIDRYNLTNY